MIQPQSRVQIVDNSGVKEVRCIHVYKKKYNHHGNVLDFFLGVVTNIKKSQQKKLTFKKGQIVRCLFLTSRKESETLRSSGIYIKNTKNNCGILVQQKQKFFSPVGNRIDSYATFKSRNIEAFQLKDLVKKYF